MNLSINGRFLLQDVTGVQRVAIEFVRALDGLLTEASFPGLEVTLWLPRTGQLITDLPLKSVKIRRGGRMSGHVWEQLELPRLARRSVLLCLGNTTPVARLIARRRPTYVVVHDLSYKYYPSAYSRLFRLYYSIVIPVVLARASHIFTVSESEHASILRQYPRLADRRRITAVQNGGGEAAVTAKISTAPRSLDAGAPDIPASNLRSQLCLYVGSLTKRKNANGLMNAAAKLVETLDTKFMFVGGASAIFEDTLIHPAHSHDEIIWQGQINDPTRIEVLYRQARVFVFPSLYEASPLPPVEAMSFGCPVVCSDIGSLRERCGDAAIYCDPRDVDSIVQQVTRVLTDEDLWRDMQRRGVKQAAQFTWRRQVMTVLDVMNAA